MLVQDAWIKRTVVTVDRHQSIHPLNKEEKFNRKKKTLQWIQCTHVLSQDYCNTKKGITVNFYFNYFLYCHCHWFCSCCTRLLFSLTSQKIIHLSAKMLDRAFTGTMIKEFCIPMLCTIEVQQVKCLSLCVISDDWEHLASTVYCFIAIKYDIWWQQC